MTHRMRLTAVALAVTALTAAGCSGGNPTAGDGPLIGSTPSTSTSPPTSTMPQPNPQPVQEPVPVPAGGGNSDGGGGNPDRCTTGELSGSLGTGDSGAGSTFVPLLLTNTGDRTCELTGFPGVSYVTGDGGEQVGPAAEMDGERGGPVELAVGEAAVAPLRLVNVALYDPAVCMPTPVRGLRIYPPGDTAALFVPRDGTGCAGTPPGNQLSVRTLTAG